MRNIVIENKGNSENMGTRDNGRIIWDIGGLGRKLMDSDGN